MGQHQSLEEEQKWQIRASHPPKDPVTATLCEMIAWCPKLLWETRIKEQSEKEGKMQGHHGNLSEEDIMGLTARSEIKRELNQGQSFKTKGEKQTKSKQAECCGAHL